jgi:outer membrane protein
LKNKILETEMTSISKIALACAALVAASGAFAQKAGDNIFSLGLASINTDVGVGTLSSSGTPVAPVLQGKLVGASATADSVTTLSASWLHMYTDNVGAEVTIGIPPKLTLDLATPNGSLKSHPAGATAKALTPAVVAKYFFNTPADKVRPYLGLGVSYVSFNSVEANLADPEVKGFAGSGVSLTSSWVPVYNAGMIYNIDDKWSINGSVSYLPIKTTVSFAGSGAATGVTTTGDLKLNTTDYVIRVGYRF